jgi:peroxiredoxin
MWLTIIVFLTADGSLNEPVWENFRWIEGERPRGIEIGVVCEANTTIITTPRAERSMAEIAEGDRAPTFTAPLAADGVGTFALSERLSEAPIVLAFFPAAFTGTCTNEMTEFRDRMAAFEDAGGTVYGVSVDSPFALAEFREQHDLNFGLISDFEKTVIDRYGVRDDFADLGVYGLAKRAVFVVDGDGVVTYRWVGEDPSLEPEYDAVLAAVGG